MDNKNNKKGFTLIELLAVIVILAIIALIAVPVVLKAIDKASIGSFKSSAGNIIKSAEQEYFYSKMNNTGNSKLYEYANNEIISGEDLDYKGSRPRNGKVIISEDGKISIDIENGKYRAIKGFEEDDITILKIDEEYIPETMLVNKPALTSGMIPVKWDSNNQEIETTADDPEWYDYDNKKWANVKIKDSNGNTTAYFVWIPRYAYKITEGYHSSTRGNIDIKFLSGISNKAIDGTKIENSGYNASTKNTSQHYFLHPAFKYGGTEIRGFWVGKYKATAKEGLANGYNPNWTCPSTADNVSTKTIQILPNKTSWRCINIKNAYTSSLNMKQNVLNVIEADTHIIKNTEWGAVAYLSKSVYGAHTEEIWNNSNRYSITGCSGINATGSDYPECIEYNTANGVKASTTHNIYGIYDMSGLSWEMTMGVYNNSINLTGFTIGEITNIPNKHIDRYTSSQNPEGVGYGYVPSIYGDAIYETSEGVQTLVAINPSVWVGANNRGWSSDWTTLPIPTASWFIRGGHFLDTTSNGVFAFRTNNGDANALNSFRVTLVTN